MRRIEDYLKTRLLHPVNGAHVGHKIIVAEARAAFCEEKLDAAGLTQLYGDILDVPRRKKLAFLDVDGAPACPGCENEVRLAAKKGGDLDQVDVLRGDLDLLRRMDIGRHGNAELAADLPQERATIADGRSAKGVHRGAIRLVVGGLENNCTSRPSQIVFSLRPIRLVKAGLSITQGPKMNSSFFPPSLLRPILTIRRGMRRS